MYKKLLTLAKGDAVVIWDGSNDVNKNETTIGLKHLKDFINYRSNTNTIALAAPQKHDLQETSSINNEVQEFNTKLHKISRQ